MLKTLGVTRLQIQAAWLVEFGCVGLVAGLITALLGTAASFAMMHYVLHAQWNAMPGTLLGLIAGCVLLMLVFGWLGTEAVVRQSPARFLRDG